MKDISLGSINSYYENIFLMCNNPIKYDPRFNITSMIANCPFELMLIDSGLCSSSDHSYSTSKDNVPA
ncbi:hypothetical protein HanIR_Chr01g0001051 [Helianthus annuus]|nr:hypothetical protein HanIR_Chr01g0001051 [Helianthus annuus]